MEFMMVTRQKWIYLGLGPLTCKEAYCFFPAISVNLVGIQQSLSITWKIETLSAGVHNLVRFIGQDCMEGVTKLM